MGQNISRTRLPAALDLMCCGAGLELECEAIDVEGAKAFDLAHCVAERRSAGWAGVSATHPFKPEASELLPGSAKTLGAPKWVFDAVYPHVSMPLLASAKSAGAFTISGFDLFKKMAIQQIKALSGHVLEADALDRLAGLKPVGEAE